jgi:hypothetical protein
VRTLLARLAVVLLVAAAPVGVYLAPDPAPAYPKHWDARVTDLVRFVEHERGLRFQHPVQVSFLDDAAFRRQVTAPAPTKADKADEQQAVEELRALGLLTGAPDLHAAADDLQQSDVVGLYDPDTTTLYVRGTDLTPYVRGTLVHELTHALQDQAFDLNRVLHTPGADEPAVRSLIEGDAVRVEAAYRAQLSTADEKAYAAEAQGAGGGGDGPDVPAVLQHQFELPYLFGPTLLDALEAQGGNDAVDRAFRDPPRVDAQVVDPREYPTGWLPAKLPAPSLPHGTHRLEAPASFGQIGLLMLVGSARGYTAGWDDVQGWRGDTWVPYRQGGRTCAAVDVATADAGTAGRLADGLRAWAARLPAAAVTSDGSRVQVRTCDPGAAHTLPATDPDPFDVLAARAGLIHELMDQGGWGFVGARCVSDRILAEVGPADFVRSDSPVGPEQARAVFERAAARCS